MEVISNAGVKYVSGNSAGLSGAPEATRGDRSALGRATKKPQTGPRDRPIGGAEGTLTLPAAKSKMIIGARLGDSFSCRVRTDRLTGKDSTEEGGARNSASSPATGIRIS